MQVWFSDISVDWHELLLRKNRCFCPEYEHRSFFLRNIASNHVFIYNKSPQGILTFTFTITFRFLGIDSIKEEEKNKSSDWEHKQFVQRWDVLSAQWQNILFSQSVSQSVFAHSLFLKALYHPSDAICCFSQRSFHQPYSRFSPSSVIFLMPLSWSFSLSLLSVSASCGSMSFCRVECRPVWQRRLQQLETGQGTSGGPHRISGTVWEGRGG